MEPRFSHDFSRVRIHTDAQAAKSARSVSAQAYTVGDHVVFAQGHADHGTAGGRRLLAHELTHVVQQSGGQSALQRSMPAGYSDKDERDGWKDYLKNKEKPTAKRRAGVAGTADLIEGFIETSTILAPFIEGKRTTTSVSPYFNVESEAEFNFRAGNDSKGGSEPVSKTGGFYARETGEIHLPISASFASALHEGIHKYSSARILRYLGKFLNEGITQYFTDKVLAEQGIKDDAQNSYEEQLKCALIVNDWLNDGDRTIGEVYFKGTPKDTTHLREVIVTNLGIDVLTLVTLGAGEGRDLAERILASGKAKQRANH